MGLPRAPFRGESERLERGVQRRGGPANRLGSLDADPDDVHPRETRERPGPADGDPERPDVGARLANCALDLRDEAFLRVSQELHRQMKLVRRDDLERRARVVQLLGKLFEGGRRWNIDGNESAEGHGVRSPGAGPFGSATNRPRSSKRPRRCPSRTAVRKILAATSPETESSAARSLTSRVPRVTAYAAAWASARSRDRSRRAYARKYSPGTRKTKAHRVAAATLMTC